MAFIPSKARNTEGPADSNCKIESQTRKFYVLFFKVGLIKVLTK